MSSLRRQSRELALQVLFQLEFVKDQDLKKALNNFKEVHFAPEETWHYALFLLEGIQAHQKEIDHLIQTHMANWRLERLALVDLNLLRIATFELNFGEPLPPAVVINEAIEIAKKYGTTDSSKFINGILDQIPHRA